LALDVIVFRSFLLISIFVSLKDPKSEIAGDEDQKPPSTHEPSGNDEDQQLKNAATIGTALMIVNSHRALFVL
jgi:hypothetical protein